MSGSPRHRSSTIRPRLADTTVRAKFAPFRPASPTATQPGTPTHNPGRIRAHLAHLLPDRHAAFTVTLTLHQLHNVPLVHGEFGLKWKIKGVTSNSGTGILDKVKARKAKSKPTERIPGGDSLPKGSDTDNASLFDGASASDAHSVANSSSHSNDHAHLHATRTQPVPIPAVIVSTNHPLPPPVARSSSIASVSSASSMSSASPGPNGLFAHDPQGYLSAQWSRQGPAHPSIPTVDTEILLLPPSNGDITHGPKAPVKLLYSPAKGITPFVRLKEHSVVWGQTLKCVVQISVARDTGELGDCLAKLVVMQRVISGDPDAPRNPRLGAVYLNLAQYVGAGSITRRYLLRQSKINATLKLTIHVEHTAGETAYVAPPLPKGEILSGVAGLLESSDIYRTRPRASDLYTDTSSDDLGSGSDTSSILSRSGASHEPSHAEAPHADAHAKPATGEHRRPFDVARLTTINDPRGTEKLIEALFNPVPVMQPTKVTPFTYLVEVDGEGDADADGERSSNRVERVAPDEEGVRRGEADEDGSLYADSPDENADEGGGMGSEYHSLRSHPSFQGSLRSKRSNRSLASRVALEPEDAGEETVVSTGVRLFSGAMERRTWWQKVLSSPNIG